MTEHIDPNEFLIAQAQTQQTQTVFTTQTPSFANFSDGTPYEFGMKFRATRAGQITAIRYWKAPSETGSHVGKIWAVGGGTPLATVTFTNETASGWQQQALSTPLNVQANTTYVVSFNINSYYVATHFELATSVGNSIISSVADGSNGLYSLRPGTFPGSSYRNSNYYCDVVFAASTAPTITKVSGDNQSGTIGTALANPLVVQIKDSAGNPLSGVNVNFAVISGGGSIAPSSAVTNSNGQASTVLTLGTTGGVTNTISATATNAGSVNFTAFTARANPTNPNPIFLENQKPGTPDWKLANHDLSGEIVGYAEATSVNKGGTLGIKVSLGQPGQFNVDVYRLGYYGGTGGRLLASSGPLNGDRQAACTIDPATRLVECNWSTSYTVAVGSDWTSGLYIAKLTDQRTGKQSQVWFVVRDDSSTSDILFQSSFTTFLAYSIHGGHSLYNYNSVGGQRAFKVSYNRPFSMTTNQPYSVDSLIRWERHMVRWLESQGYNVSYVTNMDVHAKPQSLRSHKVFLSVGHDEYWSMEERNAVEQARDAGVNIAFFSANTCYWRVRFENDRNGGVNRIMACYKDAWAQDPVAPTNKFRSPQNNKPENALIGVMYTGDAGGLYDTQSDFNRPAYGGFNFVVKNSSDRYYANTNLQDGDTLSSLVGYEWDAVINNGSTPSNLVVLGESFVIPNGVDTDLPAGTNTHVSHAVRYTAASGAKVFATGSIHWMFGLDTDGSRTNLEDPRAKQFAVNVLADMGARPQSPDINIIVPQG